MLAFAILRPAAGNAQSRTYMFSLLPPAHEHEHKLLLQGEFGYGERVFHVLGAENFEGAASAEYQINKRVMLFSRIARADGHSSAEAEAMFRVAGSEHASLALSAGGMRDYHGTNVALARVIAGYENSKFSAVANMRLEKPFADDRDEIDVINTIGVSRRLSETVRAGFEAVAEDLEGLFEKDEAEGGARMMIGPSLVVAPQHSRFMLMFTAGPVFQLTHSTVLGDHGALRDLDTRTGYIVRTSLGYHF